MKAWQNGKQKISSLCSDGSAIKYGKINTAKQLNVPQKVNRRLDVSPKLAGTKQGMSDR